MTLFDSIGGLFAIGLLTSALGTIFGMTGAVFIAPLLMIVAHLDIHSAIGTSCIAAIAGSCGGAGPFLKSGFTNVRLAIVLETATTLGGASGFLLAGCLSPLTTSVLVVLGLLIFAQQMFAARRERRERPLNLSRLANLELEASYPAALHSVVAYRIHHLRIGLCLMYASSMLTSLAGIGGDVFKAPAMDTALRLPIKVSAATSSFLIGLGATTAAGTHFIRGNIQPLTAAPLALGSVLGAILGVRAVRRISDYGLRLAFVTVLVMLALALVMIEFGTGVR